MFIVSVKMRQTLPLSKLIVSVIALNTQPKVFSNHISHFFSAVSGNWFVWVTWAVIIFHTLLAF